jgi:1-acyl-sn-glycerol-3-phosphate acyltransferase
MTKKVLGNDPFASASNEADKSEGSPAKSAAKPSAKPSGRPSKRPAAKASKPSAKPSARPSKRPSKAAPVSEPERDEEPLLIAAVPKVPAEAKEIEREPIVSESIVSEPVASEPTVAAASEAIALDEERAAIDEAGAEASVATDAAARDEEMPAVASEPEGSIEDRIRDLESQLDVLLAKTGRERAEDAPNPAPTPAPTPAPNANEEPAVAVASTTKSIAEPADESDPADIVSSEFYARQWGRVALRDRAEEVDEFGLDQEFTRRAQPVIDALYTKWWRVETSGAENVPDGGRVILCANHAGAVPYDGLMLAAALRREHPARRTLRWLADDFVFHFPFMGVALNRLGAVRACQENAERLLRSSNVVGVFPEGVKGVSKSFGERYQLQRFGRGGHIKLALRTRTPIVPVAIVGSEETHPMLPTGPIAKLLNMQFLPVTPTFPWLGPLGLVPLPSKWSITFLPAIPVDGYDKDAADDELLVGRLNEKVRAAIQDELSRRVRARQSAFR